MPKIRRVELMVVGCLAAAVGLFVPALAAPPSLDRPLLVQAQTNQKSKESQDKIDKLASQTQDALQDYLTTMQQVDRLQAYNNQISKLIQSQQQEVQSINKQMEQIGVEEKEITPLMLKMIDALQQFVQLDLPFDRKQRLDNVQQLRDLMNSADVTIAEKYRQIMGSYEDEIDYGRNMEAYRGSLNTGGKARTVDFLRVGRVALMYQTIDRKETGYWDTKTQAWKVDNNLSDAVNKALSIARNQTAPDMITVPVLAPQPPESH